MNYVCASYDHIYIRIIMYCLVVFVLQELHCLQNIQYDDAHLCILHLQSFILLASQVSELCMLNEQQQTYLSTPLSFGVVRIEISNKSKVKIGFFN